MDNHIPIFAEEKNNKGPLDYMPYRLVTTSFSRLSKVPVTEESIAFFSLKQAIFTLLLTDLKSISPQLERCITDKTGVALSVRMFSESPNGTNPEGIYLETAMTPEIFCSLCGLGYPDEKQIKSSHALLLATYNQDRNDISTTLIYEALRTQATIYLDEISRNKGEFPLQTSFQGYIHELEAAKIGDKAQSGFIEQHFFNQRAEGLFILLNKDPRFYDTLSGEKKYSYQHEYGYLLDANNHTFAEIKVIPIQPSAAGEPTAGIHLFCPAGIAALEKQTGIHLSQFADYDPGSQYLSLAHYRYDRGYSIRLDPVIQKLAIWEDMKELTSVKPASPYEVSTYYQYHPAQIGHQAYATASDHYHCQSYDQALRRLLSTDFTLFDTNQQMSGPFYISSAKIEGANFLERAWLEPETITLPGQKNNLYPAQVNLLFYAKAPLNDQMTLALPKMEGFAELNQAGRQVRKIPIARVDRTGIMEPVAANMILLRQLLNAGNELDVHELPATAPIIAASTDPSRCRLQLHWQDSAEYAYCREQVTIPDLATALNMLMVFTPKQFARAETQQGLPWLKGASIFDLEEGRVLAHLFCEFPGTPSLGPGMYLNILAASKELIALVAARTELKPLGSISSGYLQYADTRFSLNNPVQHPRIIQPDPHGDHPRLQS